MIVRTVLGDIAPEELGVTYAHEHLIIDSATVAARWPDIHLPSVAEASEETAIGVASGVRSMIDAMPTGSGRDLGKLADVAKTTGLNVIASTGMHIRKYYEGVHWAGDDALALAARFIQEIEPGVAGPRAGIMKVATSSSLPTQEERDLFVAAGIVHGATGVPILTHCEEGKGAIEQIAMLVEMGVEPHRVILSHTDKVEDRGYHREILTAGANVEYDQSLRQHLIGSTDTALLIAEMWGAGFGHQILLGTDGARRSLWSTLGGAPGLAWLWAGYPAILRNHGLGDEEIEAMFVTTPARVLAF